MIAKQCPCLTTISLWGCGDVTGEAVSALVAGCPRLTSVDVSLTKVEVTPAPVLLTPCITSSQFYSLQITLRKWYCINLYYIRPKMQWSGSNWGGLYCMVNTVLLTTHFHFRWTRSVSGALCVIWGTSYRSCTWEVASASTETLWLRIFKYVLPAALILRAIGNNSNWKEHRLNYKSYFTNVEKVRQAHVYALLDLTRYKSL